MHMLYDSDTFVVMQMNASGCEIVPRHGFEIVDKRSNTEVYLDGPWAQIFQDQLTRWDEKTPEQEEVEMVLDSYSQLAYIPLLLH